MKKSRKQFIGESRWPDSYEPYEHFCCFENLVDFKNEFTVGTTFSTHKQTYVVLSIIDTTDSNVTCELYDISNNNIILFGIIYAWRITTPTKEKNFCAQLMYKGNPTNDCFTMIREVL